MVQCNDGTQIEVHPVYEFTTDEWFMLQEGERIRIREEGTRYKRSRDNDNKTVVSEITTGGVQDDIRLIPQRISAIDLNTGYDHSVQAVNVKKINA